MVTAHDHRPDASGAQASPDSEAALGTAPVISTVLASPAPKGQIDTAVGSPAHLNGDGNLPAGVQTVDDLLNGSGQKVGVGAGGQVALDGPVASSPADIGEAFHQATDRFSDAILPSRPPRLDTQVRHMRHACVPATETAGPFRWLIHNRSIPL
jgi:hypothetical protein